MTTQELQKEVNTGYQTQRIVFTGAAVVMGFRQHQTEWRGDVALRMLGLTPQAHYRTLPAASARAPHQYPRYASIMGNVQPYGL